MFYVYKEPADMHSLCDRVQQEVSRRREEKVRGGAQFNVFQTLHRSRREDLHTRFASDLLDPDGSHGQGAVFLECFLDEVESVDGDPADALSRLRNNRVTVSREKPNESGKRPDIRIESRGALLLIENKVDAEEGDGQLENYLRSVSRADAGLVIFLTPSGRGPQTVQPSNPNLRVMAYHGAGAPNIPTIDGWLERCIERTGQIPRINQTLIQYHDLIHQEFDPTMSEFSTDALLSTARGACDLAAAHAIHKGYPALLARTTRTIMERVEQQLSQRKETAQWTPDPDEQPSERVIAVRFRESLSKGKGPGSRQMGYTDNPGIALQVGSIDGTSVTVAVEFVSPDWRLSYKVFLIDGSNPVIREGNGPACRRADGLRKKAVSRILAKCPEQLSHCDHQEPKNAALRLDTRVELTKCSNPLAQQLAQLDGPQFDEAVGHLADEVHRFALAVASACDPS